MTVKLIERFVIMDHTQDIIKTIDDLNEEWHWTLQNEKNIYDQLNFIDIDMMKENATDIGTKQESSSPTSSIDNLLNISVPQVPTDFEMKSDDIAPGDNPEVKEDQAPVQYITPAEKIVKTEAERDEEDDRPTGDYFKPSDLASVELPDSVDTSSKTTDQVNLSEVNQSESNNPMTLNEAKQALRNTIDDIKGRGINISTNEMDFNTNYQMIIKIEKNQ